MHRIDLTLECPDSAAPLHVFLNSPLGSEVFTVAVPADLARLQQIWQNHFIAHHDPEGPDVPADRVRERSSGLSEALQSWLQQQDWALLQRALELDPALPLRLRCRQRGSVVDQLPWEALPLGRPIWRLPPNPGPSLLHGGPQIARRPRLLLLVGDERGLDLDAELSLLQRLSRQGGLELSTLRGEDSNLAAFQGVLHDRRGWDGLVFLGHSSADVRSGGRLQLADGRWLSGQELRQLLAALPDPRLLPRLVLLNSCSGPDLANSLIAAGVSWVVCFREPIPSQAASLSFCHLLEALQQGLPLTTCLTRVRQELATQGPAGCQLLLSAVGADNAEPLVLPLSRRRQLRRRLAGSTRTQAISAASLVLIASAMELMPTETLPSALLDRRLALQRQWRLLTRSPEPSAAVLPVLLLNNRQSPAALGVAPTPNRHSRALLVEVLKQLAPQRLPVVGLDLVIDEANATTAEQTARLEQLLRLQRRPLLLAGWYGTDTCANGGGTNSRPLKELQAAGLQFRDLATATRGYDCGDQARLRSMPLQLIGALSADHFAGTLALALNPRARPIPEDAVIDWSIDWSRLVKVVDLQALPQLQTPVLVVGSDGTNNPDQPDLFAAPSAIAATLSHQWGLTARSLPGALLQAVLSQSMALQHWLRPASLTATTALAAALGVLVAAGWPRRRDRLVLIAGVTALAIPCALQIAANWGLLIPLALPALALAATALLRREHAPTTPVNRHG